MKYYSLVILLFVCSTTSFAQKYITEKSTVHFFSSAPVEDIEATNAETVSIIDLSNGEMVFSIPMTKFKFEQALMEEHFNENYLESDKYPKASFKATASNWETFTGNKEVEVKGDLTIHGVTKEYTMKGDMSIEDDKVVIDAKFKVELVDHKIKIPKAVFYNIAEVIDVTVHFEYKPYQK